MKNATVLIHISDIHFVNDTTLLRGFTDNGSIFTKRHLGWINYRFRRKKHFDPLIKKKVFQYLLETHWDYLIISGDLTTLSLNSEFEQAREAIFPLMEKGTILLTAGNHDRYTKKNRRPDLITSHFHDCWPYNKSLDAAQQSNVNVKELNDSAIVIELDMAIPRAFSSRGKISDNLTDLRSFLEKKYKNKLKIAIGHYPAFLPLGEHEGYFHEVSQKKELQQFLLDSKFDYYLHGHIHKSWMFKPRKDSDLLCINSGGCCRYLEGEWAGFHEITIENGQSTVKRILV